MHYLLGEGDVAGLELCWTEAADRFIHVDSGGGNESKERQNKDGVSTVQLVRISICSAQFHVANVADQLKELIHSSLPILSLIRPRKNDNACETQNPFRRNATC